MTLSVGPLPLVSCATMLSAILTSSEHNEAVICSLEVFKTVLEVGLGNVCGKVGHKLNTNRDDPE